MTRPRVPPPSPRSLLATEFMLDNGYLAARIGTREVRIWREGKARTVGPSWAIEVSRPPDGLGLITDQSRIGPTGVVEDL